MIFFLAVPPSMVCPPYAVIFACFYTGSDKVLLTSVLSLLFPSVLSVDVSVVGLYLMFGVICFVASAVALDIQAVGMS